MNDDEIRAKLLKTRDQAPTLEICHDTELVIAAFDRGGREAAIKEMERLHREKENTLNRSRAAYLAFDQFRKLVTPYLANGRTFEESLPTMPYAVQEEAARLLSLMRTPDEGLGVS